MPEQAHYRTTPEQGWSQMKSVLDQEMPIEKRSSRFILFWWSTAGIVLLGLAGLFLFQSKAASMQSILPQVPQQESPKSTLPIQENQVEENKPVQRNDLSLNDSGTSGSTVNNNRVNQEVPESKSIAASNPKLVKKVNSSASNNASTASNTETQSTGKVILIDADTYTTTEAQETNSIAEERVLTNTIEANSAQDHQRDNQSTAALPALDIAYFTIPESELGAIQASEFTKSAKHGIIINPNVETNVLIGFPSGTGWYAGAGANLKLSPKFDLTAGLGYRSFSPGTNLFSTAKADLASDPTNNTLVKSDVTVYDGLFVASEAINNASYQDLDPVIEKVKQWQATVGLDWRFSRKFSLEAGAGLAFHTRAYSEYPIVPSSYIISAPAARVSNSLEGYDVIRKTMASCFVGASYHIGKHVALKLQWLHTFQPYLSTDSNNGSFVAFDQRDDFIRGITVGMKYSIL